MALLAGILVMLLATPAHADHAFFSALTLGAEQVILTDEMARTIKRGRPRQAWRIGRDRAIRIYANTLGQTWTVQERRPSHVCEMGETMPDDNILICRTTDPVYASGTGWASGLVVGIVHTAGKFYSQWVVCHEVGHVLGLGHRAFGEPSCMSYDGPRFPDTHDLATLVEVVG